MKLNVVENAKRNMFWGAAKKVWQIVIPFVLRSVFIRQLGIKYVGLGGLFSSLLSFLNLAEMGISSAVLYFLYQPVAENDEETIRKLLGVIKNAYRWIGFLIFGAGLALMPLLHLLISEEVPADVNIYVLYLLNLLETVLSYWLFAGKSTVLEVHQRNDISNRIYLITLTIRYGLQFAILLLLPNYYIYLIIIILTQVLEKIFIAFIVDQKYPRYRTALPASREMKRKVSQKAGSLLFHRIGNVIVNSADALVITGFLGLSILGKYQNYLQIMMAVSGIIGLINASCYAGIGNTMAREGIGAAYRSFEHDTFLEFCISTVCCCCFLNLYQPFIAFWVGADMLLEDGVVILLCLYFYFDRLMAPGNMFENIGGVWNKDKYRPFMEGFLNLGINLLLVQFAGMYGILLSTILSKALFSMPWLYHTVVGGLFKKNTAIHMRKLLQYTISTVSICAASYFVCRIVPSGNFSLINLFVKALVSGVVPISLLYILYHRCGEWQWMVWHISRLLHLRGG